jgi:geranyl-CoA carboxylase beta subunit
LLKAATGEVATEEDLGGAEMHSTVSGLGDYLAEDDRHALGLARELLARTGWSRPAASVPGAPPRHPAEELLGLMPASLREPVDMREVMGRIVDDSDLLEFKPLYGAATVCVQAAIDGHAVGLVSNNGPIDVAGAGKATQFIQWMCQLGHPIVYLQNTTGYMVGTQSEQGGIVKHGAKMLQAVANATVPQVTILLGGSFGAGNYGMCGRAFHPRFIFAWPNARTAVMGGEQAAKVMSIVAAEKARRAGQPFDEAAMAWMSQPLIEQFERESDAFHCSARLFDDGVIDPRDTRRVLGFILATCDEAARRTLSPNTFGVARL